MTQAIRVLLIEDNEDDALLIVRQLKQDDFDVTYQRVDTLKGVKDMLSEQEWDCVISDYSLPHFRGLAALAEVKASGKHIPFILVSGTIGEELAVTAMKWGASDYIMKENLSRLAPAVKRELKEAEAHREQKRTNEALRSIEQRFRRSFEDAPIGMAIMALDGRYQEVNSALCRILGYSEEELIGLSFKDITHPGDLENDLLQANRMVSGDIHTYQVEKRYAHKDGHYVWVQLAVSVVRDQDDKASYFISQIQNISERKEVESQSRLLAEALDSARDCIFLTDAAGRILFANRAVIDTYGFSYDELIGEEIGKVVSLDTPLSVVDEIRHSDRSGGWKGELNHRRKDGTEFPVELWTSSIHDDQGASIAMVGVVRNISERRAALEELRRSEEQFRLIAENVGDMVVMVDLDGRRIYNSPSYRNILGDPESLKWTDAFREVYPDDVERVRQVFRETVESGIGQRIEYRLVGKDGAVRNIDSMGSVVRGKDDAVSRVVVVSRDITEEKKLAAQFLRAQRMESIGTLAGGIAHDLNNILAPMMMAIGLLSDLVTDSRGRRILASLETSAQRGSDIVKQVLAFGRGVAGDRILIQLKHIIGEVSKIVDETFPKTITLNVDLPRDLWAVLADPTQMQQVLLNMLVNARDAMPAGGTLTVTAQNVRADSDSTRGLSGLQSGDYVAITIADTGTGLPPEIRERIFEPFFTTKEVGRGTGLGLSTSLGIVKSHGGYITVDTVVGRGTTFSIFIPASKEAPSAEAAKGDEPLPTGNGESILIIDDEAAIREIAKVTLEAHGYKALTASDGAEGVGVFAQHSKQVKVVITDMMMPIMGGEAVIVALKRIRPNLKIIATSGLPTKEQAPESGEGSVQAFLAKPYTAEMLLKTLARVLGNVKAV